MTVIQSALAHWRGLLKGPAVSGFPRHEAAAMGIALIRIRVLAWVAVGAFLVLAALDNLFILDVQDSPYFFQQWFPDYRSDPFWGPPWLPIALRLSAVLAAVGYLVAMRQPTMRLRDAKTLTFVACLAGSLHLAVFVGATNYQAIWISVLTLFLMVLGMLWGPNLLHLTLLPLVLILTVLATDLAIDLPAESTESAESADPGSTNGEANVTMLVGMTRTVTFIVPMTAGACAYAAYNSWRFKNLRLAQHIRTRALRQAEAASEAKSSFLASMSHELRTPLTAIIGYAELLEEETEAREEQEWIRADLCQIHDAATHLLSLINDLLDLAKVEAGRMQLKISEFDVTAAMGLVRTTVQPLIESNGNEFLIELDPNLGTMCGDSTRVCEVVTNLLSNAGKFTSDGQVRLMGQRIAGAHGDQILFTVSDTGVGMSRAQLGHLFEPFHQFGSSVNRTGQRGTGLGMAITKRYVDLMHGDMTVESQVGVGTVFTVTLPTTLTRRGQGDALAPKPPQGVESRVGGEA